MPDFTLIESEMCLSVDGPITQQVGGYVVSGLFSERHWPACNCPAYRFARNGRTNFSGRMLPNPCKHIQEAETQACGWHKEYSPEPQVTPGVCPKCGGPTVVVKVAV